MDNTYSYVTVLANWLSGYDRYRRVYSKEHIAQSTFENEFYLLQNDFAPGIVKAEKLQTKLGLENNTIIRIETIQEKVHVNTRTNIGYYIDSNEITVENVYIYENNKWLSVTVEELTALAYDLQNAYDFDYLSLKPLTLSFLPVAIACQASCRFCFSGSSISIERKKRIKDFSHLNYWCETAKKAGAKRFVLTGGGEPTIMPFEEILECFCTAKQYFDKTVLITNGIFLAKENEKNIEKRLKELKHAGLDILSFSYHHYTAQGLTHIMGLNTNVEKVLQVAKNMDNGDKPTIRLICVLQKEGVGDEEGIEKYLDFASQYNITQVCFKELYVSSTTESLYAGGKENKYSQENQIPLSMLIQWLDTNGEKRSQLPWGSPIYKVERNNVEISVVAYTEPSVGWEKANQIARSWNYMADDKCFVSLEDERSIINIEKIS